MFTHFSSNGLLVKIFLRHLDKSVIFDKHDAVVLNEDGVKYVIACTSALGTGELRNAFDKETLQQAKRHFFTILTSRSGM